MASSVIKAKNRSTKLSQDEEVGMKCSTLVPLQPVLHLLCLVCRVVVEDEVQIEHLVHSGIDLLEKADEFLGAMASPAFADHLAGLHVEGGKQRGSAVALVVVRHRLSPPLLERQTRLRCGQALGSGSSHRRTAPEHPPAGSYRGRQRRRPSQRNSGHSKP